jgi:hypothetical protein
MSNKRYLYVRAAPKRPEEVGPRLDIDRSMPSLERPTA